MIRALWTASTGMQSQQVNMDVIANNLANVNSSGLRRAGLIFRISFIRPVGPQGPGSMVAKFLPVSRLVLAPGSPLCRKSYQWRLQQTENELDLAIEGSGFFQVTLPDGAEAYTRSGAMKKDSTGRLVTSDGYPLVPEIVIPEGATKISIGSGGTVDVVLDGETDSTQVGTIELVRFGNPSGLSSLGRNLYAETPTTGAPQTGTPGENGFGTLSQGFLEGSNVNIMEEMVNMIAGQRAYEVNSKAIKTADEMLSMTSQLIR